MNTYALCTVQTGIDALETIRAEVPLAGVIGLSAREATDEISGYVDIANYCKRRLLPCIQVDDYRLRSDNDRKKLLALDIDLLLVIGWQRLIPGWLIEHCRVGAVGAHGSAEGITAGRGRSPQNWALLLGQDRFSVSLFWIDPAIDSGPVIATRQFPLTEFDDIRSSYLKVTWLVGEMICDLIRSEPQGRKGEAQHGEPRYLPQRRPPDGAIDWRRSTHALYDFVRALTRPYPGAFSELSDGRRLRVWRCRPFELGTPPPAQVQPGQIVRAFQDGALIVRTGDGLLLLDDVEWAPDAPAEPVGIILPSCDYVEQMRGIVEEHRRKYPKLPLSPSILKQAGL